jgi:hypothetical protein
LPELKEEGMALRAKCEMDRIGRKRGISFADPIEEIKGDGNMRGQIKLFTLNMVPQNAQQIARTKSANNYSFGLGQTGFTSVERMLLQAPQ